MIDTTMGYLLEGFRPRGGRLRRRDEARRERRGECRLVPGIIHSVSSLCVSVN